MAALRAVLALQADDPTASTTVRDPDAAADRHVADSLVALELPAVRAARRIADLGSGAGWPGPRARRGTARPRTSRSSRAPRATAATSSGR